MSYCAGTERRVDSLPGDRRRGCPRCGGTCLTVGRGLHDPAGLQADERACNSCGCSWWVTEGGNLGSVYRELG